MKRSRWRRLKIVVAMAMAAGVAWGYLQYRSFFAVPLDRLALDRSYPEMPPDERHRYIRLPLDHGEPASGQFEGFYILSPAFHRGDGVVFLLTDGQMQLVGTRTDFAFFEQILGGMSYVLIGHRGHPPTLLPEVYRPDRTLDYARAVK